MLTVAVRLARMANSFLPSQESVLSSLVRLSSTLPRPSQARNGRDFCFLPSLVHTWPNTQMIGAQREKVSLDAFDALLEWLSQDSSEVATYEL